MYVYTKMWEINKLLVKYRKMISFMKKEILSSKLN